MENQIPLLVFILYDIELIKLFYGLIGLVTGTGGAVIYLRFFYVEKKKVPVEIQQIESQIHKTDAEARKTDTESEVQTINAVNNFLNTLITERKEVYTRIGALEENNNKKLALIMGLREDLRTTNDKLDLERSIREECQERLDRLENKDEQSRR